MEMGKTKYRFRMLSQLQPYQVADQMSDGTTSDVLGSGAGQSGNGRSPVQEKNNR